MMYNASAYDAGVYNASVFDDKQVIARSLTIDEGCKARISHTPSSTSFKHDLGFSSTERALQNRQGSLNRRSMHRSTHCLCSGGAWSYTATQERRYDERSLGRAATRSGVLGRTALGQGNMH